MPNRSTHEDIGTIVGIVTGIARIERRRKRRPHLPKRPLQDFCHLASSTFAGKIGARLPDQLEPAVSSWHRGPAHSVAITGILASQFSQFDAWEDHFRDAAEKTRNARIQEWQASLDSTGNESVKHLANAGLLGLMEALQSIIAGIPAALSAGYISHNVADMTTPRGLPLVGIRWN